jgi:hypothetical protein
MRAAGAEDSPASSAPMLCPTGLPTRCTAGSFRSSSMASVASYAPSRTAGRFARGRGTTAANASPNSGQSTGNPAAIARFSTARSSCSTTAVGPTSPQCDTALPASRRRPAGRPVSFRRLGSALFRRARPSRTCPGPSARRRWPRCFAARPRLVRHRAAGRRTRPDPRGAERPRGRAPHRKRLDSRWYTVAEAARGASTCRAAVATTPSPRGCPGPYGRRRHCSCATPEDGPPAE